MSASDDLLRLKQEREALDARIAEAERLAAAAAATATAASSPAAATPTPPTPTPGQQQPPADHHHAHASYVVGIRAPEDETLRRERGFDPSPRRSHAAMASSSSSSTAATAAAPLSSAGGSSVQGSPVRDFTGKVICLASSSPARREAAAAAAAAAAEGPRGTPVQTRTGLWDKGSPSRVRGGGGGGGGSVPSASVLSAGSSPQRGSAAPTSALGRKPLPPHKPKYDARPVPPPISDLSYA